MHPNTRTPEHPNSISRFVAAAFSGIVALLILPFSYSATKKVSQDWQLYSDYRGSLKIYDNGIITGEAFTQTINLNGHTITLDSGGIESNPGARTILRGGVITSSTSFVDFYFKTQKGKIYNFAQIESVISDSNHRVGLRVTGNTLEPTGLGLSGNRSNNFTGDVEVIGQNSLLTLQKTNGAIAVRSDIYVKNNAVLRFENNNQLSRTSSITLKGHGVLQVLSGWGISITNTFHNLNTEDDGVINFNHTDYNSQNSKYYLKVDDLLISKGGHLAVDGWKEGRDFLLVRKDSKHLGDALTRMSFAGYDPGNIHLEEFDNDYWAISATPEPAACGALLGATALGLWLRRKRRRRLGAADDAAPPTR